MLQQVFELIQERKNHSTPAESYVASLLAKGDNKILKKLGEEATEVVLAAKDQDRSELIHELADLWFHSLVLMVHHDLSLQDLDDELRRRFGRSGLDEKASRPAS
jgi:phosphoribosyl-ATP pyrophosphohydrolase